MKNIFYTSILLFVSGLLLPVFAQTDGCGAGATLLTINSTCTYTTGNNSGFTNTAASDCTIGTVDDSGWFRFVATATSHTITVDGAAGFDAVMAVYSNCTRTAVAGGACVDNTGDGGIETITATGLTVGVTYFIEVHHYYSGSGSNYQICITGPPANATCATAASLPCGTVNLAGTTVGTSGPAHGTGCTMSNNGVWYTFTGNGQNTTITVSGGTLDAEMAIVSGSCGSFTNVTCQDNGGAGGTETHTFLAVNGTTYYVYVAHYTTGTTTGTFNISRSCAAAPVPPANDLCTSATSLPCATVNLAGTTVNTTNVAHGTGCSLSNFGVWYTFTGNGQITTITVSGGTLDAEIAIVSGSCGSFTNIACEDGDGTGGTETYTFLAANGVTYYVYVADYLTGSTTTGTFNISRSCTAAATNDDPCGATSLTVGAGCSFTTYNNTGSTNTSISVPGFPIPTCGSYSDNDVWFSFVVPASGHVIIDSDAGSIIDGAMAIYRGANCNSLTELDCDDDGSLNLSMPYIEQTTLIPGETIWIRFWDFDDGEGTFDLCVYDGGGAGGGPCTGGAGGNDCDQIQPICTQNVYCYTAGIGSTASSGNDYGCLSTQPNPSWYYFEISTAGNLVFDLTATSDIDFAVWGPFANVAAANAACGTLGAPVDCSYSTSPTEEVNLTGVSLGQIYVLVVTNYANVVQDITIGAAAGNTAATNCAIVNPTPCAADAGNW